MNKNFSLVETGDGSLSLYSTEYDELMHTRDGAYEESVEKHLKPSLSIQKLESNGSVAILDVGFGMGYNILALLHECGSSGYSEIVSLEMDRSAKEWVQSVRFNDARDEVYGKIKEAYEKGRYADKDCSITVLFGDARESVRDLFTKGCCFDTVFHDPFSPSKNPELWTVEYFSIISKLMKRDAILTTYSSASQVRMAMLEAGLLVARGPSTGKKRESTRASKSPELLRDLISEQDVNNLKSNPKAIPYRDRCMKASREEIVLLRREAMRNFR